MAAKHFKNSDKVFIVGNKKFFVLQIGFFAANAIFAAIGAREKFHLSSRATFFEILPIFN